VSLTYDDAVPNQIKYHVPLMEERGFRGTFFVFVNAISRGQRNDWKPWAELAARGHEIGSHTVSHPRLVELSEGKIEQELRQSKSAIEEHIGVAPLTFAYPYGQHDERVRRIAGGLYVSSRSGGVKVAPPTPLDIHDVPSFVPVTNTPASEMNSWVDAAVEAGGWTVEMIHGIEAQGWQPIPKERYAEHFDYIAARGDELWVAPYGEVARYIREREVAAVETINVNADGVVLELLSRGLDQAVYSVPLTLRLEVPFDFDTVEVRQAEPAGREVKCIEEQHHRFAYFDVVPNGGEVVVKVIKRGIGQAELSAEERAEK